MTSDKKQELKMLVYDFAGILIQANSFNLNQGANVFLIETDKWKPGTYVVQLITQSQTIHKKLIIQRQAATQ
jgi:hypothetical protein